MAYGAVVVLVLLSILVYSLYLSWNRAVRSAGGTAFRSESAARPDSLSMHHAFNNQSVLVY